MDNNTKKNGEKDIQIYDGGRRPFRARRSVTSEPAIKQDEQRVEDSKTRVDMPTVTDEIISSTPRRAVETFPEKEEKKEPVKIAALEEEEEETDSSDKSHALSAMWKSVAYIIFVICTSIIVSYIGITVANDVFAFVKDEKEVSITVTEKTTFRQLASELEKKGVIDYPLVFRIYNSFKNSGSDKGAELEPGEYTILANLNYDELIYTFSKKAPPRTIVRITFPEGLTADEMIAMFVENGVGTKEGFERAISSSLLYDMDYPFLKQLQETEKAGGFKDGRRYVLEGYLYPDTYDFYTDSPETDIVAKLLATFNRRFEEAYYERCDELEMSVDEIVNLASIVQMETKYDSEYETVSSLYHNRLNNPVSFPRLQCDSTYLYVYPERRAELTLDEMKASDSPYSTYSHDGLPPSAICSPSLNAIIAALYPNATDNSGVKHTYYYMYARPNGYHYFAKTEYEHLQNIERANREAE